MSIKHRTGVKAGAAALALAFIMGMAGCVSLGSPAARESAAQEQPTAEEIQAMRERAAAEEARKERAQ
jgi:hypothetical protein